MEKRKFEIEILNVSKNIDNYEYMVVTFVDGAFWYYGASHSKEQANEVAKNMGNAFVIDL